MNTAPQILHGGFMEGRAPPGARRADALAGPVAGAAFQHRGQEPPSDPDRSRHRIQTGATLGSRQEPPSDPDRSSFSTAPRPRQVCCFESGQGRTRSPRHAWPSPDRNEGSPLPDGEGGKEGRTEGRGGRQGHPKGKPSPEQVRGWSP